LQTGTARRAMLGVLVVGAALGLAGCGTPNVPKAEVAKQISDKFAKSGQRVQVSCPNDVPAKVGSSVTCTVQLPQRSVAATAKVAKVDGGKATFDIQLALPS
jgi:hypothetical protein